MTIESVIELLEADQPWDALDALIVEWRRIRHGRLASASHTLAAGLEPLPPPSTRIDYIGGLFRVVAESRAERTLVNPQPEDPHRRRLEGVAGSEARSGVPLQGSVDLDDTRVRRLAPSGLLERLSAGAPTPLLQLALGRSLAAGAIDLRDRYLPDDLLIRSGDPEFGDAISTFLAGTAAGRGVLERLARLLELREPELDLDDRLARLDGSVTRALERVTANREAILSELASVTPPDDARLQVLADMMQERGDPWGRVMAAQLLVGPSVDVDELVGRHGLRWSQLLGPGVAHQRTQFRRGLPHSVYIEERVPLVALRPSPLWRFVEEMRVRMGDGPGLYTPDQADEAALSRWFTDERIRLSLLEGAEWVAPALMDATRPARIETMVFGVLPALNWSSIGLRAVSEVRANDLELEGTRALLNSMPRSGLDRVTISSLGRWRLQLKGRECHFELIAPGRREEVVALAAVASNAGFNSVAIEG